VGLRGSAKAGLSIASASNIDGVFTTFTADILQCHYGSLASGKTIP
jgi:hypothetical protein